MLNSKPVCTSVQAPRLDFGHKPNYNKQMRTFEHRFTMRDGDFTIEAVIAEGYPGTRWTPPEPEEITDLAVLVGDVDITELLSDTAIKGFEDAAWSELEKRRTAGQDEPFMWEEK